MSIGDKDKNNGGTANLQPDSFNVKYTNIKGEENTMSLPFDVYPLARWSTNSNTSKLVPVQNNLIPNDAQRFNVVDNEKTGGQDITVENPKGGAAYNVTLGRAGVIDVLGKKVNTITIIASTGDKINTSGEIEQRGITTEWGLDPIKNKKYIIDTFGQDAYDDAMSVFKTGSAPANTGGGSKTKTQSNTSTGKTPNYDNLKKGSYTDDNNKSVNYEEIGSDGKKYWSVDGYDWYTSEQGHPQYIRTSKGVFAKRGSKSNQQNNNSGSNYKGVPKGGF